MVAGLAVGDRVVVDGTDRLRDGAPVRIVGDAKPGDPKPGNAKPEGAAAATGATMPAAQGQPSADALKREHRRREQASP